MLFPEYLTAARIQALREYTYQRGTRRQQRLAVDHPLVETFWEQYDFLNVQVDSPPQYQDTSYHARQTLNHSSNDALIAISLPHMNQSCETARMERLDWKLLKKLLPASRRHRYVCTKNVKSPLLNKTVHCWIFEKNPGTIN